MPPALDERALYGEWFLPDNPGLRSMGVLRLGLSGIQLTLIGPTSEAWEEQLSLPVRSIVGSTIGGGRYSLLECSVSTATHAIHGVLSGLHAIDIRVGAAVVGLHVASIDEFRPAKLEVQFTGLEDWLDHPPPKPSIGKDDEEVRRELVRFVVPLGESGRVALRTYLGSAVTVYRRRLELQDEAKAVFKGSEPLPLQEYINPIRSFRSLLLIAAGRGVNYEGVTYQVTLDGGRLWRGRVIGGPFVSSVPSQVDYTGERHVLFTRSDVDDIEQFVSRWMKRWIELEAVHRLFAFTAYREDMVLEERFLNVVRICEAFHRLAKGGLAAPHDEHERRMDEIQGAVPVGHRTWLEEKLRYSNELSLRQRLRELLSDVSSIAARLPIDPKRMVQRTAELRNLLVHHSGKGVDEARDEDFTDMLSLADWWTIILEASLLRDAGLPAENLERIFKRDSERRMQRYAAVRALPFL